MRYLKNYIFLYVIRPLITYKIRRLNNYLTANLFMGFLMGVKNM